MPKIHKHINFLEENIYIFKICIIYYYYFYFKQQRIKKRITIYQIKSKMNDNNIFFFLSCVGLDCVYINSTFNVLVIISVRYFIFNNMEIMRICKIILQTNKN